MIKVVANVFPMDNALGEETKKKLYSRVEKNISYVKAVFEEKADIRENNFRFYKGDQWTEAEKKAHKKQFRISYVFNEIQHKVGHVLGSQIQTKMEARVFPREKSDSEKAELMNFILKWVEQTNEIDDIEKNIFLDGLVGGVGATIVRWERYGIANGLPVVERVPADEIVWDINSVRQDLRDAKWCARITKMYKSVAAELFPMHQKEIENASSVEESNGNMIFIKPHGLKKKAVNKSYIYSTGDKEDEIIQVIEYYERRKIYQYLVGNEINNDIQVFDDEKDATAFYQGLVEEYSDNGETLLNPDGTDRLVINTIIKDAIWQTFIVGDTVIEYNLTDLPDFPIVMNFGYFHDGEFWSFVDNLISPQILINRSFSQWDYQLGTATKNLTTVIEPLLKRGFDIEDYRTESSRTAAIIPVIRHDAIEQHPNNAPSPALFDNISFGIQRMNDYAGGRNALGLQENAAESGRAVIARAEQGGLARLPLFDNLKIWRRGITERLIWWIKNYMTAGQIIRVIGDTDEVQYMDLDDEVLGTLREIEMDVHVSEASKTDTVNERYFEQLKELFATMPGVPPDVVIKTLMPFSSIPEKQKQEVIEYIGGYQDYMKQQEEAKHEQKLKDEARDQMIKKQIKDEMERGMQLDEQKKETEKKGKLVKTQLDKLEKLKEEYINQGGDKMALQDKLRTPEDMGNIQKMNISHILK